MKTARLFRMLTLGAVLAVGGVHPAWAAPVAWTGSLTIDFTDSGGTSATYPTAFASTAIINGGSGVMTPITKLTLSPVTTLFSGNGFAYTPYNGVFGFALQGINPGMQSIVLSAGGTCGGPFSPTNLSCPGGGLAGHGGLRFIRHHGILNSSYVAPSVFGGGNQTYVSAYPSFQRAAGAGWTTGQVQAHGYLNYLSVAFYSFNATSTGGVAGSTISLVSPLIIVDSVPSAPFFDVVPGIARLTVNLSTVCGNGLVEPGETCDDGNASAGDGCSATCQVEAGYECTGAPSVCIAPVAVSALKLIIVDKLTAASSAKAVFVAKDGAITKGTGTNTSTIGVTLDFTYNNSSDPPSAGQFVASAGSPNWLVNKDTVAKYVNKTAPTGGGTKVTVIKPGNLVKLVGKSLGDTPIDIFNQGGADTGVAQTAYCVDNGPTHNCFCSTFAACSWKKIAADTGAKLVCKTGTSEATCAARP